MTEEEYKRWEAGLPPLPKKKVVREEPEFPKVENQIRFESIPLDKLVRIEAIRKHVLKNPEGAHFIGFDIEIEIKDSESLAGWIGEGDLYKLLPFIRQKGETDQALLHSIGY